MGAGNFGRIYLVTNKVNGKVYVGQTVRSIRERWNGHCSEASRGKQRPLCAAIRKHGRQNFEVTELEVCDSQETLDAAEVRWIATHRAQGLKTYNGTSGGRGTGPEYRQTVAEKMKALWSDPEYRARQRASRVGRRPAVKTKRRPVSDETRARIAAAGLGRKRSAESIAKGAAARRGKPMPREVVERIAAQKRGVPIHSEERKRSVSEQAKALWKEPSFRAAKIEALKGNTYGAANRGKPRSAETRRRISEAQKGRRQDPDAIRRMAETKRGQTHSTERREAQSQRLAARWSDPEFRTRMLAARRVAAERKAFRRKAHAWFSAVKEVPQCRLSYPE